MNLFCCGDGNKEAERVDADKLEKLASSQTSLNVVNDEKNPIGIEEKLSTEDEFILNLYPLEKNDKCYAKLTLPKERLEAMSMSVEYVPIVVILDRSGSMGDYFNLLLTKIVPEMLLNIGYRQEDPIEVICFEGTALHQTMNINEMMKSQWRCQGGTFFAPAVKSLHQLLMDADWNSMRILTVSDGDIGDRLEATEAASQLASFVRDQQCVVNSAAVRYFTSTYGNPDTTALCSLLQLSTTGAASLIEVSARLKIDEQVVAVQSAFLDDGMDFGCSITASAPIFQSKPWATAALEELPLRAGENEFWICDGDRLDKVQLRIGKCPVRVVMHDRIKTAEQAALVMRKTIAETTDRLKVLKIVNSPDSLEQIRQIIAYYEQIDRNLTEVQIGAVENPALSARVAYLKKALAVRSRGFYNKMAQVANDDTVSQLNAAQKADYLRTTTASRTSRGLAKRALKNGLNFDEVAREEAKAIVAHLAELDALPEETNSSFYSLESTIGGLRSLKELVKADKNDELTATEILQVINLVGMAAKGAVGDYPDPMTYRLDRIYPNCFVSISDLLTAKLQGGNLTVPGFDNAEITTVVPVFEDFRLAKFLKKYAPTLLSYSASIGMRGMVADVSMTDGYTLCAGIWKLVEEIAKQPSELKLRTFKSLCDSYDLFVGDYFSHVEEHLTPAKDANDHSSMYLANFGTTNMIGPLYRALKKNPNKIKALMPRILRALFSYEMWQAMRRLYKGTEKSNAIITETLNRILGVDFEKYGRKPAGLFQEEPEEVQIHGEYHVDWSYLHSELINKLAWYVKYVALLPVLLEAAANGSILKKDFKVPSLDDDFFCGQLDVSDMEQFWFLCTAQAFYFPFASDRSDKDSTVMRIPDLKWPQEFERLLRDHCTRTYRGNYDTQLSVKLKAELGELKQQLLDRIFAAQSIEEVEGLLKQGLSRGPRKVAIETTMSLGYIDWRDALLAGRPSPIAAQLIRLFLLTRSRPDGEPAFNGGRVAWVHDIDAFERAFLKAGGSVAEWTIIKETYQTEAMHTYRTSGKPNRHTHHNGKPNRHTHHNGKPSYWAMGFGTLEAMRQAVSEAEFQEYCAIHHECCGVSKLSWE